MYKKILVPLDMSELAECALAHVRAIAVGCEVQQVVLLTAVEPLHELPQINDDWLHKVEAAAQALAEDYLTKVADSLRSEGIAVQTVICQGRASDEILDYASKNEVDLLIMSTHGRSGVSRWVLGSVADKVLRHSPVPVLTASPPACRNI